MAWKNGPSHCWHCGRQLVRIKGGFKFRVLVDQIGNEARVHIDCVREGAVDGVTEKRSLTLKAT